MKRRNLVLLHGWGAGAGVWQEFAKRLAPQFRIHALDLPGYGATPTCDPYTLEALAHWTARHAPRRCCVIGWSLGGQVALAWARRARWQVERAVLVATTPCFLRRTGWPHGLDARAVETFSRQLNEDPKALLDRFSLLQAHGDDAARRVARRLRSDSLAGRVQNHAALERGLNLLAQGDLRSRLAMVRQPVLVLHGAHDRVVPPAAGRHLAAALPRARFRLMRGCSHAPFVSKPARTATTIRDFLDE